MQTPPDASHPRGTAATRRDHVVGPRACQAQIVSGCPRVVPKYRHNGGRQRLPPHLRAAMRYDHYTVTNGPSVAAWPV